MTDITVTLLSLPFVFEAHVNRCRTSGSPCWRKLQAVMPSKHIPVSARLKLNREFQTAKRPMAACTLPGWSTTLSTHCASNFDSSRPFTGQFSVSEFFAKISWANNTLVSRKSPNLPSRYCSLKHIPRLASTILRELKVHRTLQNIWKPPPPWTPCLVREWLGD